VQRSHKQLVSSPRDEGKEEEDRFANAPPSARTYPA
jgi:hypothetical protein